MADIGQPQRKYTVVPLKHPVETPDPGLPLRPLHLLMIRRITTLPNYVVFMV